MSLNLARKYIYKKKKFIVRTKQTVCCYGNHLITK